MRWVPLLAVVFLSARPAAAAPCAVPTWIEPGATGALATVYDTASPECATASSLIVDFAKLRAAAGFSASSLAYYIDPDPDDNAYYVKNRVALQAGYLRSGVTREAFLATLGHEIGHAVQDRMKKFEWRNEPWHAYLRRAKADANWEKFLAEPEGAEYYARKRRLESHADLIGQELLARAGYGSNVFASGRAVRFGCDGNLQWERNDSHPASAQRYINAAMDRGALSAKRARLETDRIMEGLGGPRRLPAGDIGKLLPREYTPAARVEDFDAVGRLRPGRAAAEAFRVPPAPTDAGVVREHAHFIAGSVVDFWIARPFEAAVDGLAEKTPVAKRALAACGKPEAARFEEEYGTGAWIRRVATNWATGLVRKKERPMQTVSGAVPG